MEREGLSGAFCFSTVQFQTTMMQASALYPEELFAQPYCIDDFPWFH
jgi:hypothetical protein